MIRFYRNFLFCSGASFLIASTALAQTQNAARETLHGHSPAGPRPPKPPQNGPQYFPQNGGYGSQPYTPQPYPVIPYPYDDGWSGAGAYAPSFPPMQEDPGSHVTINGKTFPPRNSSSQGMHSSVHVDGQ